MAAFTHAPCKNGKSSDSKTGRNCLTAKSGWEEHSRCSSLSQILLMTKQLIKTIRTISGDGNKKLPRETCRSTGHHITTVSNHLTFNANALQPRLIAKQT